MVAPGGEGFETFSVERTNRLAHAAALTVAERPKRAYNPLLILGPADSGKSHLLAAITGHLAVHHPRLTVRLLTGTDVTSVDRQPGKKLRPRWLVEDRVADVLLIDDIDAEVERRIADVLGAQIWRLTRHNRHQVVMTARTMDYGARSAFLMSTDLARALVVRIGSTRPVAVQTRGRVYRTKIG